MPYDKDKFDNIHILLPKKYRKKLEALAEKHQRKISPFIVYLIVKAIEADEKRNP
jgi:molybdopterin-guanine dinucleotide biosynthesis protein A